MLETLNNPEAKSRHTTQYFEMAGNRGIYQDGWFATTVHRPPWEPKPRATFENDKWELYNVEEDFSCAHDLAAKYPDKLEKLKGSSWKRRSSTTCFRLTTAPGSASTPRWRAVRI